MAATLALCVVSSAVLYAQLKDKPLDSVLESPLDQPPLVLANAALTLACSTLVVLKVFCRLVYATDPLEVTWTFIRGFFGQEKGRGIKVDSWITEYNRLHDDNESSVEEREGSYAKLVNAYYELATLFYEWGWGSSFHFASRWRNESFQDSIKRHEYYLGGRLGVSRGAKVLDCGCGIGGPYRNIAQFTGADITGITINEYQVKRGNEVNKKMGVDQQCRSIQGDFMKLPFEDNSFDGVYAIEATCHAPQREGVYSEIYRVLKPGCVFACYEWCLTDKFDASNDKHRLIKKQIEEGDGLPDMITPPEVDSALKASGFEILETRDAALDPNPGGIPWYQPLTPSWNVFTQRFQFNWLGMRLTKAALYVMEMFYLAPAGTNKVQAMLQAGGMGCAQGGLTGTFTPMYLAVCRKPL
ncbi:unnamed protein product [Ectocarpus sp. 6 AP-2014]